METKLIDSPWIVREQDNELQIWFEGTEGGVKRSYCVAVINGGSGATEQAEAKLIAAAPELLEAVMILLEDNCYDITLPIEGFSHRTQKVIEAIQKATS